MGRRILVWTVLICCSLTVSASALTADDYVVAGRAALFERTHLGLSQACDVFAAGIEDTDGPDGGSDQELIFLHAVARTAKLFVDCNDVLATKDFFALAGVFGVPLDGITFWDDETEETNEDPDPSPNGMAPEKFRLAVGGRVLPELETILSELDAIEEKPGPFVIFLVPEETGLAGDLEIDFGDVLILKGLLLAYKGSLGVRIAHDAAELVDDGDARQDALWGHEDLSRVLSGLAAADDDTGLLAQARQDWIDALTCHIAAVEHMAGEDSPVGTDPQEDEFVYVDLDAQPRLDTYRQMLAMLRNSLLDGATDVVPAGTVKTYDLYNADLAWVGGLTLVFDLHGAEGHAGRLVLADGTVLDIDWLGNLDEGQIGVSMFSGPQDLEGWFEATLDGDLDLIHDGTLDLWGTRSATMVGLTGRMAEPEGPPAPAIAPAAAEPFNEIPKSEGQNDWEGPWAQAPDVLRPVSPLWFAFGNAEEQPLDVYLEAISDVRGTP